MTRLLLLLLVPSVVAAVWKVLASIVSQPPPVADVARPSITHPCVPQAARRPRTPCNGPKGLFPPLAKAHGAPPVPSRVMDKVNRADVESVDSAALKRQPRATPGRVPGTKKHPELFRSYLLNQVESSRAKQHSGNEAEEVNGNLHGAM